MKHPYIKYENSLEWKVIHRGINELIKNKDLELQTEKKYIIGYLCMKLEKAKLKTLNK